MDTTVLTNCLLKSGPDHDLSRAALGRYDRTELPVYAIKEFKAGPLRNWVWFHNVLVVQKSFGAALGALHRMALTPRRYTTATALEALRDVVLNNNAKLSTLSAAYGKSASVDRVLCDQYRLAMNMSIKKAWRRRRSLVSAVVHQLPCYREQDPTESSGLLSVKPDDCAVPECSLGAMLRARTSDLERMRAAIVAAPDYSTRREHQRRAKALKEIIRKPKAEVTGTMCRDLGDCVIALLAPNDSVILTTNRRDHDLLAGAIGKLVASP